MFIDQDIPNFTTQSVTFSAFTKTFTCHGEKLFETIFERNPDIIKIKKKHIAIANLKRLFSATFKISSKIGFHEMSLRDLSRETGISMGSIYSCISKKDNLAIIVKDVVGRLLCKNIEQGNKCPDVLSKLETTIRLHFYTSCILQPWFSFLYLETRSLPGKHQDATKQIETDIIDNFATLIDQGIKEKLFETTQGHFLAHNILVLLQDWYLKPWKHMSANSAHEKYVDDIIKLTHSVLGINKTQLESA